MKQLHNTKTLPGKRYGRLLILSVVVDRPRRKCFCLCECGEYIIVWGSSLNAGFTRSCGCYRRENSSKLTYKHGLADTPIYNLWLAMKRRCYLPTATYFEHYGGRGIKVCKRWMNFENFYKDMGDRPPGLTLNRINNDGDYEPSNCEWATWKDQQNNRRNNKIVQFKGRNFTLSQLADHLGLTFSCLRTRLHRGWSLEKATMSILFKPGRSNRNILNA